jgi:CBS-domain-containing membrane protein
LRVSLVVSDEEVPQMNRWLVSDVMTTQVVSVRPDTGYQRVADLLVQHAISAVPVVSEQGVVLGVVSEVDLLPKLNYPDRVPTHPLVSRRRRAANRRALGDTAGELMSSPAETIGMSATLAQVARRLEAARVRRLPVVDDAGRLVGIVSRRDLVRLYARPDADIWMNILQQVVDPMWIEPSTVDVQVSAGVVTLTGQVDRVSTREILVRMTHAVPGVVDVVDQLTAAFDDSAAARSSWSFGHPFSAEPREMTGSHR